MTPDGADRILRAVGSDHYSAEIDRSALIRGLELCANWHREAVRYSTDKAEKEQLVRLGQISKTAKKLRQLLQAHDRQKLYDWDSFALKLSGKGDNVLQSLDTLTVKVEDELKRLATDGAHTGYVRSFQKRSAFEWLVGYWLPMVYMGLPFRDPGSKEAYLASGSPYISFAFAALDELKFRNGDSRYSRAAVAKAASMPFSQRLRRKAGAAEDHYKWWRTQLMRKALSPHLFLDDDGEPSVDEFPDEMTPLHKPQG